jgi:hypothetical protein
MNIALAGGLAASPLSRTVSGAQRPDSDDVRRRYAELDVILKQPVLKRELFGTPIIIERLELLRQQNSFLCRVRSREGAEGISVSHSSMSFLYPIFGSCLQPFFIGKDVADLDLLLEKVYVYNLNFRLSGMALGIPLATIEFAILDMLGRIAGKALGQLIGEIHHPRVRSLSISTGMRRPNRSAIPCGFPLQGASRNTACTVSAGSSPTTVFRSFSPTITISEA